MAHIDSETFEAFMAFESASMAFSEVTGPEIRCQLPGDAMDPVASDLLVELRSAHSRLRDCDLPVPWDHPRCQQHGTTSHPHRPAGVIIPGAARHVKQTGH